MAKFNFLLHNTEVLVLLKLDQSFLMWRKALYVLGFHSQQQLKPRYMEALWKWLEIPDVLHGKFYRNTAQFFLNMTLSKYQKEVKEGRICKKKNSGRKFSSFFKYSQILLLEHLQELLKNK